MGGGKAWPVEQLQLLKAYFADGLQPRQVMPQRPSWSYPTVKHDYAPNHNANLTKEYMKAVSSEFGMRLLA